MTDYETPIVTIDVMVLTIEDDELKIAVLARDKEPEKGKLALIGGWVHTGEDETEKDVLDRVLLEKAGLRSVFTEQLYSFMGKHRDPRRWSVSVAYLAFLPLEKLKAEAVPGIVLRPARDPGPLAFDHNEIVAKALTRVHGKGAYSSIPARFLPEKFTMVELHQIYKVLLGVNIDQSHFRRKMTEIRMIEEIPGERVQKKGDGRPAKQYRLRPDITEFDNRVFSPR